jgi:hypothetical protein
MLRGTSESETLEKNDMEFMGAAAALQPAIGK